MPDVPLGDFLTPEQVAEILGISRTEVIRQVRLGRLHCFKINRVTYKFTRQHIQDYLGQVEVIAPAPVANRVPAPRRTLSAATAARLRRSQ
jgi:excisionase family DNA binding protein